MTYYLLPTTLPTYYLLRTTYYPYYLLILTPTTPKYASKGRACRWGPVHILGPLVCNPHHHGAFFCGARWRATARRFLTAAGSHRAAPTSLPGFSARFALHRLAKSRTHVRTRGLLGTFSRDRGCGAPC